MISNSSFSKPVPFVWAPPVSNPFHWLSSGIVCFVFAVIYIVLLKKRDKDRKKRTKREAQSPVTCWNMPSALNFLHFCICLDVDVPDIVRSQQEHFVDWEHAGNCNRKSTDSSWETAQPCGWDIFIAQKPVELASVRSSSQQFLGHDQEGSEKLGLCWFPGLHFFTALCWELKKMGLLLLLALNLWVTEENIWEIMYCGNLTTSSYKHRKMFMIWVCIMRTQ